MGCPPERFRPTYRAGRYAIRTSDYPLRVPETIVFPERLFMRLIKGSLAGLVLAGILAMMPAAAYAHEGEVFYYPWYGGYYEYPGYAYYGYCPSYYGSGGYYRYYGGWRGHGWGGGHGWHGGGWHGHH